MKKYDFLYLTNSPAFYKINLMNEIARQRSVMVIFLGYSKDVVNIEITDKKEQYLFDYIFLTNSSIHNRNKIKTFFKLKNYLKKISFKKVIYTGWNDIEFSLMSFLIPPKKNCLQCESSIYESHFSGIKGFIKKIIINRMSVALVSGEPHKQLFEGINYKGKIYLTQGVGIFNKIQKASGNDHINKPLKYLYVGRLIDVKNVEFLVSIFNQMKKPLTIVGAGILDSVLRNTAKDNIEFRGFIENEKIAEVYQEHDIFVLPSKKEPWGLVVEEAIYNGLPVIVSEFVGCNIDIVEKPKTGCVFLLENDHSFIDACDLVERNYESYKKNAKNFNFDKRDEMQVETYLNLLK
uniref:glycosyltransferase n=1 Tax=uncultured Dysgonomonas sp. TaxID=206096 RepID=UPI00262D208B|nr:glycosyltransferase [uncultured Dysgonomonas sp.]